MKMIVTVLLVLVSAIAGAQESSFARPQIKFGRALIAQANGTSDGYSDSEAALVSANLAPPAPIPAIPPAMVVHAASLLRRPPVDFKPFSASKVNRTMVAAEFWSRGLDAYSTYADLNNSCRCYHESSRFLGFSMTPIFKSAVGAYSYSLGLAAGYSLISAKIWNASKNHPRHARLLHAFSRVLLLGDSSMESTVDVRNFTISGPAQ